MFFYTLLSPLLLSLQISLYDYCSCIPQFFYSVQNITLVISALIHELFRSMLISSVWKYFNCLSVIDFSFDLVDIRGHTVYIIIPLHLFRLVLWLSMSCLVECSTFIQNGCVFCYSWVKCYVIISWVKLVGSIIQSFKSLLSLLVLLSTKRIIMHFLPIVQ